MTNTYAYDNADRLAAAKYLEGGTVNDKYSTSYAYDAMGNITSLTRRGKMSNGTYNQIDNLTMTYNGNQLTKVTDAVTSATASGSMDFRDGANVATEYTYDANGNMTSDLNKGITNIQYNFLNLPSKVTFSNGGTVTYFYDATGSKVKVVHAKAGKVHTMEYTSQQDMSRMKNIVNDNRNAEVWLYIPKAKNPQCRMLDLVNWKWIDY